jgi:predicted CoA-binding protein
MAMEKKKTLILGASTNPGRYAYKAAHRLTQAGHPIVNIGIKEGVVAGEVIQMPGGEPLSDVDTITLYVGPQNQQEYYDYIVQTRPRRIIFNPGTENNELIALAEEAGIEPVIACTLVMLSTGEF